jgi:hypothetical protein
LIDKRNAIERSDQTGEFPHIAEILERLHGDRGWCQRGGGLRINRIVHNVFSVVNRKNRTN